MRLRTSVPFTLIVALALSRAWAQEASDVVAETYIEPKPLDRPPPTFPKSVQNEGKEGWVMVSYVVSPSGDIVEPMIEDSSGIEALERSALDAVRKWRYSPALRNGTAIEQSMTKTRIVFALEGARGGVTAEFQKKYRDVLAQIKVSDFQKAAALLQEIEFGGRANLSEDAWFWWLKFSYLNAAKSVDRTQRLQALRMAVGYEEDYLPPDLFVTAAQQLYAAEVEAKDLSGARQTFVRLRDSKAARQSKYYEQVMAGLKPHYELTEQAINGNTLLVSPAEISRHEYWVHDLLRRRFSMAQVQGRIDVVDVRCKRGTKRYDSFPQDGVWTIPASWGDCGVYIKGEPGTTFVFQEHPLNPVATEAK